MMLGINKGLAGGVIILLLALGYMYVENVRLESKVVELKASNTILEGNNSTLGDALASRDQTDKLLENISVAQLGIISQQQKEIGEIHARFEKTSEELWLAKKEDITRVLTDPYTASTASGSILDNIMLSFSGKQTSTATSGDGSVDSGN